MAIDPENRHLDKQSQHHGSLDIGVRLGDFTAAILWAMALFSTRTGLGISGVILRIWP